MDETFKIEILSFSYKSNSVPKANLIFDVRFIDNPYWVEKLRSLTGLDKDVQDFVLKQTVSQDFISAFKEMAKICISAYIANSASKQNSDSVNIYSIAFGCTGGQHRSVAVGEQAAIVVNQLFPGYTINIWHKDIGARRNFIASDTNEKGNEEDTQ
jgi:RNase adapter protein RapZ